MVDEGARVGEPAPDFTLTSMTGQPVRLGDLRGVAEVVLFFYPRDNSPACTTEACSFRDSYEAFRDAGAEVIGVSSDSVESHRKFAGRLGLPFPSSATPAARSGRFIMSRRRWASFPAGSRT